MKKPSIIVMTDSPCFLESYPWASGEFPVPDNTHHKVVELSCQHQIIPTRLEWRFVALRIINHMFGDVSTCADNAIQFFNIKPKNTLILVGFRVQIVISSTSKE